MKNDNVVKHAHQPAFEQTRSTSGSQSVRKVRDPVHGMSILPEKAYSSIRLHDYQSYPCSVNCESEFSAHPDHYLSENAGETSHHHDHYKASPRKVGPSHQRSEEAMPDSVWTRPICPEVRHSGPGSCPVCGMALEPLVVMAFTGQSDEPRDMTRRFWPGLPLALPVLVFEMGSHLFPKVAQLLPSQYNIWLQLLLAIPVAPRYGWSFFLCAGAPLRNCSLNTLTPVAMGMEVVWVYGVIAMIFPSLFPVFFRIIDDQVAVYLEAVSVIMVLVLLEQVLGLRAREQTSDAVTALLNLALRTARRLDPDGHEADVKTEDVLSGGRLRARPDESVPVDGTVLEGHTTMSESTVTGESMPVIKTKNGRAIGRTINQASSLIIQAEKAGNEIMLFRTVQVVVGAQRSHASIQRMTDSVSEWSVSLVILITAVVFMVWAIWGLEPRVAHGLIATALALIIVYLCALGLTTSMPIMVGVGKGVQSGVLIKNARSLERFERAGTLVVDKAGTLTEGAPTMTGIISLKPGGEEALLRVMAAVEEGSQHPLGMAMVNAVYEKGIMMSAVSDFSIPSGRGASGDVEGLWVIIGNELVIQGDSTVTDSQKATTDALRGEGATVIYVATDGQPAGLVVISDPLKAVTPDVPKTLCETGICVVTLTGDNQLTAETVAHKFGIEEAEAEALPDGKKATISHLKALGHVAAMARDGVNGISVFAVADAGIIVGTGTDVAMESVGATFLKGDLMVLNKTRRLSEIIMKNIRQNLFSAFIYSVPGVSMVADLLRSVHGILFSPMITTAAVVLSSISVIVNALRPRSIRSDRKAHK